jgi:uncharacterized membrane protein YfcA
MEWWSWVGFLLAVFVGSYIQSVAGFAMGMIIVAVVGGLRLLDVPTLTATISLLTILNVFLALRGQTHFIHRRLFLWLALGQVPAIYLGLLLMTWLDGNTRWLLEVCLGLFVTLGGLSMSLKPHPWPRVSGPVMTWLTGVSGGLVGGMFSASGPVLGWFGYSQPLQLVTIRATLLACFVLTTGTRTVLVGMEGGLTEQVLHIALAGLPVVFVGTWLGRNFAPPLAEDQIRRGAYVLLLVMGVWMLGSALLRALPALA